MPTDISTDDLLSLLYARGYRIVIQKMGNSQFVSFHHSTAVEPLYKPHSYSMEFTPEQIHMDVAWDLLQWAGLKIRYTLDY